MYSREIQRKLDLVSSRFSKDKKFAKQFLTDFDFAKSESIKIGLPLSLDMYNAFVDSYSRLINESIDSEIHEPNLNKRIWNNIKQKNMIDSKKLLASLVAKAVGFITTIKVNLTISKRQLRFRDRQAAGSILANLLIDKVKHVAKSERKENILVMGIPRGGVIIAETVARKLSVNFNIIVGMKVGMPHNKKNAIGAIMEDGTTYLDQGLINKLQIPQDYINNEILQNKKEIELRSLDYRGSKSVSDYKVNGRLVILVDDGAVTGATIIAAARSIRKERPDRLIIALPIASSRIARFLKNEADEIEVIFTESDLATVGQFYDEFLPITNQDVLSAMRRNMLFD